MPSELKTNVQRKLRGASNKDSEDLQEDPLKLAVRMRRLCYDWAQFCSSLSNFQFCAIVTEVSPGLSHEALEPSSSFFFFFPASGSIYLFIVTFMSSVQGNCWVQQHQPWPEGRQGNTNPSLSLMGLVTLAESFNLNMLGPLFSTEQGNEWALDHLERVSGGITN